MLRSCNICMDIMTQYLSSVALTKGGNDLNKKSAALKCLSAVFSKYGGVLGKIAQILSFENEDSDTFDKSNPLSSKKTHEHVMDVVSNQPKYKSVKFANEIYRNGSLGQVYKGNFEGSDIVIKVQYLGVKDQSSDDFSIIDFLVKYLYSINHLENAIIDIKSKMNDELDYRNELANQLMFYEMYKNNDGIKIPKVIPELCGETIVCMEYMKDYIDLTTFIKSSTQDSKNIIGNNMIKFVFESIYKNNLFYSDNHYGNFLVKDKTLCVLDFGCVDNISSDVLLTLKKIHKSMYESDKELFIQTMQDAKILTETTSEKSKQYCYDFFKLTYEPLTTKDFVFSDEWVDNANEKEMQVMSEWSLPRGWIYLHKIPYGLYHILGKMNCNVNCGEYLYETYIK